MIRKGETRIYFVFSSSMARSNFSTASWKRCWSSRSSPLLHTFKTASIWHDLEEHLLIILRLTPLRECLERSPERRHAISQVTRLVLRDGKLDLRENKGIVEGRSFRVVLRRFGELIHDEEHCGTPCPKSEIRHTGRQFGRLRCG